MAFTNMEKDCLRECHALLSRKPSSTLTDAERADLDTIVTGDEAEKRLVVKAFIETHAKPNVENILADIDADKAALQARQSEFQAWLDANP
jgi:hypothetical protein